MSRAFELERRGNYAAAADAYRARARRQARRRRRAARSRARAAAARIGARRSCREVRAALAANPSSGAVFGVALRAWAAADRARQHARRRGAVGRGSPRATRRRTANGARPRLARRDRAGRAGGLPARAASGCAGRTRSRRSWRSSPSPDGDFAGALREWLPAIRRFPGYRVTAVSTLRQAPDSMRPELLRQLERRVGFLRAAAAGGPPRALGRSARALSRRCRRRCPRTVAPGARGACAGCSTSSALQPGREARLAHGPGARADRRAQPGRGALAPPARGGAGLHRRRRARRRAPDAGGHRRRPQRAGRDLVRRRDDAGPGADRRGQARRGRDAAGRAPRPTWAARSMPRCGDGWRWATCRPGDLARADSTLGRRQHASRPRPARADPAVPGRRGRRDRALQGGRALRRRPRRGHRAHVAARACSSRSRPTRLPALGQALLPARAGRHHARPWPGSSASAGEPAGGQGRRRAATAGRAAGRREPGSRRTPSGCFRAAAAAEAPATAPGGRAGAGGADARPATGRQEAVAQLEHLILTYPASALVPQARRALDEARGAVPDRHDEPRATFSAGALPGWRRCRPALRPAPAAGRGARGCSCRWTTRRRTTQGVRPRVPAARARRPRRSGCSTIAAASFLLPADAATARDAALDGITIEPLDDGAAGPDPGRDRGRQHGRGAAGEGAQGRGLRAAQRAAVGRRGDDGAQLRRASSSRRSGTPEVLGDKLKKYDWLHLHHEDFTGPVLQVLPQLRRRALAGGHGRAQPGDGAAARLPDRAGREGAVAVGDRGVRGAGRVSVRDVHRDGDARSRARGRRAWTSRPRTPTGRRWIPTPSSQMHWERGARLPGRAARAEPDRCRCTPTSTGTR